VLARKTPVGPKRLIAIKYELRRDDGRLSIVALNDGVFVLEPGILATFFAGILVTTFRRRRVRCTYRRGTAQRISLKSIHGQKAAHRGGFLLSGAYICRPTA